MQRLRSRFLLTAGFTLIALIALVSSSSGVSANPPYPECGPAIPCAPYGYAPYAYSVPYYPYIAPYYSYRVPYYAYTYPAPVYAPTYFYDGVNIAADVFTRNGCALGNYTCLRDKGVRMSFPYVPYPYTFGYVYH